MTATAQPPADVHDAQFRDTTPGDPAPPSNGTALATREASTSVVTWTPDFVTPVAAMIERKRQRREFFKEVMEEGLDRDYAVIPGTGQKPSLLKAGAEKLLSNMSLHPIVTDAESPVVDYTGEREGRGEPLIRYKKQCSIYVQTGPKIDDRVLIAQSEGVCTSREAKYRYRDEKRKCPNCGAEAIIKGKEEYGGGWVCFARKGGCGAKFADDAPAIVSQKLGRILNPEIADVENTIAKIAEKRAVVGATLYATGCSDIFTQDVEEGKDSPDGASVKNVTPGKPLQQKTGGRLQWLMREIGVTTGAAQDEIVTRRLEWIAKFGYTVEKFSELSEVDGQRLSAIAEAFLSPESRERLRQIDAGEKTSVELGPPPTRAAQAAKQEATVAVPCEACGLTEGHKQGCPEDPNPPPAVDGDDDEPLREDDQEGGFEDDGEGIDHFVDSTPAAAQPTYAGTPKLKIMAGIVDDKRIGPERLKSLLRKATDGRATELTDVLESDVDAVLRALSTERKPAAAAR